ncbi:hypothetical protein Gasu2_68470 [Galdieria sulphuraria]|uniref:Uncharacterized protein n=1 Tax=Galdieria sulphuraria TaxID=130081 RepID=M2Y1D8_GALSU|nr:uncharacterized protein Gasu_30660 [Galdieria sulphuraria]EME29629.1 hypothetical protein Gasu_30660 [Galdieria sulphuraria]GJD12775.1 hypothetical protein Gasu2_68470 [Galdieria sulphuraria]|eukprot:XP_005706149.1 hypothetical protein Gasu_30660 [Galdieria sulphuraria]
MQSETTLVSTPILKLSFLRIPSIFRKSKSTPEPVSKESPSFREEKTTTTIKDVFPVTRYATHSVKKQQSKKEKSTSETTTITTVPKRKSPRKKRIDTSFRGLLRNENQSSSCTEDKVSLEHTTSPPTTRVNTVEEGVATAAAAKLLLEASQRMQDQESVDSRMTSTTCSIPHSLSYPTNPCEQPLSNTKSEKTGTYRVVLSTDTVEYIHQILKREEDICRWQQVMLNFLVSKTNTTKSSDSSEPIGDNEMEQQQPWEQLLQEQKKQLVIVKELIEKADLELVTSDSVLDKKHSEKQE